MARQVLSKSPSTGGRARTGRSRWPPRWRTRRGRTPPRTRPHRRASSPSVRATGSRVLPGRQPPSRPPYTPQYLTDRSRAPHQPFGGPAPQPAADAGGPDAASWPARRRRAVRRQPRPSLAPPLPGLARRSAMMSSRRSISSGLSFPVMAAVVPRSTRDDPGGPSEESKITRNPVDRDARSGRAGLVGDTGREPVTSSVSESQCAVLLPLGLPPEGAASCVDLRLWPEPAGTNGLGPPTCQTPSDTFRSLA